MTSGQRCQLCRDADSGPFHFQGDLGIFHFQGDSGQFHFWGDSGIFHFQGDSGIFHGKSRDLNWDPKGKQTFKWKSRREWSKSEQIKDGWPFNNVKKIVLIFTVLCSSQTSYFFGKNKNTFIKLYA